MIEARIWMIDDENGEELFRVIGLLDEVLLSINWKDKQENEVVHEQTVSYRHIRELRDALTQALEDQI